MNLKTVQDPEFALYGRVLRDYDTEELMKAMEDTPVPQDVVYLASVPKLEELSIAGEFSRRGYGRMPIQVGYCNGHNQKLNALEYHRSSELNLAVTDLVLLLGREQDITREFTYDTGLAEAFFVPAGTLIEVYATTLHYAPCHTGEQGFRCVVVLPAGTNEDLGEPAGGGQREEASGRGEDRLLFARNKWLLGHEEGGLPEHAWLGLTGENIHIG